MVMEPMHVSAMEANWNKGVRGHLSLQNFFLNGRLRRSWAHSSDMNGAVEDESDEITTHFPLNLRSLQLTWPKPQFPLNGSVSRSLGKGSFPSKALPPFPTNLVLIFHGSLGFAHVLCGPPDKIFLKSLHSTVCAWACYSLERTKRAGSGKGSHWLPSAHNRGTSHLFPAHGQ